MSRYIDAEKIEYEEHKRIGLGIDYGINESDTYYTTTKEEIDAIPTADVVERKKGKWVAIKGTENGDTRYTCPECGASYECDSRDVWDFNFCPHCGTELKGK